MSSRNKIDNLFRQGKPLVRRLKSVKPGDSAPCPQVTISPAASASNLDAASSSDLVPVADVPTASPSPARPSKTSMCLRRSSEKSAAATAPEAAKAAPKSSAKVAKKTSAKPPTKASTKSPTKPPAKPPVKPAAKLITKSAKSPGKPAPRSTTKPVLRSQRVLRQRRFTRNALLITDGPSPDTSSLPGVTTQPRVLRRTTRKISPPPAISAKPVKKSVLDTIVKSSPKPNNATDEVPSSPTPPLTPLSPSFHTPPPKKAATSARAPRIPQRSEPAFDPSPATLPPSAVPLPTTSTARSAVVSPPELLPNLPLSSVSPHPAHSVDSGAENRPLGVSVALFGNDGILGSDADDDDDGEEDEPCVVRRNRLVQSSNDPLLDDILSFAEDVAK